MMADSLRSAPMAPTALTPNKRSARLSSRPGTWFAPAVTLLIVIGVCCALCPTPASASTALPPPSAAVAPVTDVTAAAGTGEPSAVRCPEGGSPSKVQRAPSTPETFSASDTSTSADATSATSLSAASSLPQSPPTPPPSSPPPTPSVSTINPAADRNSWWYWPYGGTMRAPGGRRRRGDRGRRSLPPTSVVRPFPYIHAVRFANVECVADRLVEDGVEGDDDAQAADRSPLAGTCYTRDECVALRGTPSGPCAAGYGVCCVLTYTCRETVHHNVSYFVQPTFPDAERRPHVCPLRVAFRSNAARRGARRLAAASFSGGGGNNGSGKHGDDKNDGGDADDDNNPDDDADDDDTGDVTGAPICQIRLDLVTFDINGPQDGRCKDDMFVVVGANANHRVPPLCGANGGQHLYLNVDTVEGPVELQMLTGATRYSRRWRVKISLLPCRPMVLLTPATSLRSARRLLERLPAHHHLAPAGCLQYHTGTSGTLSSFNFGQREVARRGYLNDLDYAICIRRERDMCSITYTVNEQRKQQQQQKQQQQGSQQAGDAQVETILSTNTTLTASSTSSSSSPSEAAAATSTAIDAPATTATTVAPSTTKSEPDSNTYNSANVIGSPEDMPYGAPEAMLNSDAHVDELPSKAADSPTTQPRVTRNHRGGFKAWARHSREDAFSIVASQAGSGATHGATGCTSDYLAIPGVDHFCGDAFNAATGNVHHAAVTARGGGPFMLLFHSDSERNAAGFDLEYNQGPCASPGPHGSSFF